MNALLKPVTPSPALAVIVGSDPIARSEITKRVWEYIRARNLQDPTNKRMINADATLRAVVGRDRVSMFELSAIISKHLT